MKKMLWVESEQKGGKTIRMCGEKFKKIYGHQSAGDYERLQRNEVTIIAERD